MQNLEAQQDQGPYNLLATFPLLTLLLVFWPLYFSLNRHPQICFYIQALKIILPSTRNALYPDNPVAYFPVSFQCS